jgi:hypothetical protein
MKEIALADNPKVDRANAQFAKLQRAEDGKKAMSEYEAERVATLAKTERLKELRLARDAGKPQPSPTAKSPVRRKRKNAKSLESFLNDQNGSGRRG